MIYLRCLRCLREFEKWSKVEKIGENWGKLGKIAVPESPFIHYYSLQLEKVLAVSELKSFSKNKPNVNQGNDFVSHSLEIIMEKGKRVLVTNIFSFSHKVFKWLFFLWESQMSSLC